MVPRLLGLSGVRPEDQDPYHIEIKAILNDENVYIPERKPRYTHFFSVKHRLVKNDGLGDKTSFLVFVSVILLCVMTLHMTVFLLSYRRRERQRKHEKENGG
jgi:hypothetical protein